MKITLKKHNGGTLRVRDVGKIFFDGKDFMIGKKTLCNFLEDYESFRIENDD